MKRGGISNAEKFYIEKNPDNMTLEQMAKKLGRSEKAVSKYWEVTEKEVQEQTEEKPLPDKGAVRKLMGHRREATVMTPAASEMADEMRKINKGKKLSDKMKSSIFKPFGDE